MARVDSKPMVIPDSVTQSAGIPVAEFSKMTVFLIGTFVATVQFQISPDGTTWMDIGAALTAPGFVELPVCEEVRADVTAFTSGDPEGLITGVLSAG